MSEPVRRFRPSFWWLFFYVMAISAPTSLVIGVALVAISPGPIRGDALLFGFALALGIAEVVAVFLILAYVAYFQLLVGPSGLRGPNAWGLYRDLAWDEVTSVKQFQVLGMRQILVLGKGKPTLWLPVFLADLEGLYLLICHHAGPEHPLALFLHAELA
jgi:hypothetical protein